MRAYNELIAVEPTDLLQKLCTIADQRYSLSSLSRPARKLSMHANTQVFGARRSCAFALRWPSQWRVLPPAARGRDPL